MKDVLSFEQVQHLQELGLNINGGKFTLHRSKYSESKHYYVTLSSLKTLLAESNYFMPTLTLTEIIDIVIDNNKNISVTIGYPNKISYNLSGKVIKTFKDNDTLINAAYEMLCWAIEDRPLLIIK